MRNSFVKMAVVVCALVAGTVGPVAAQSTNVGANVTFLREESEDTGVGFSLDVARNFNPTVGVVGEFGLNTFDQYNLMSFLGGLRYSPATGGTIQPFVQALFGLERCGACDDSGFGFQIGGGVEVPVSETLRVRGQYDFRRTTYDGEGFTGHRFGFGVIIPLGN